MPKNGRDRTPSAEDLRRWADRYRRSGRWFPCFNDYVFIMKIDCAWVLQRIINLGEMEPKNARLTELREQGWIRCTVEWMEKNINLKKNAQKRVLNALAGKTEDGIDESRAFITVKNFGIPPERFIKINTDKIDFALDELDLGQRAGNRALWGSQKGPISSDMDGPISGPSLYSNRYLKDQSRKDHPSPRRQTRPAGSSAPGSGGVCAFGKPKEEEPPALQLATSLYRVLERHRKITCKIKLGDWKKHFEELLTHRSLEEVTSAIEKYDQHLPNENINYLPTCYCARTFCQGFSRLEKAFDRIENPISPSAPPQDDLTW